MENEGWNPWALLGFVPKILVAIVVAVLIAFVAFTVLVLVLKALHRLRRGDDGFDDVAMDKDGF